MCLGRRKKVEEAPLDWKQMQRLVDTYDVDAAEIDVCWRKFLLLDSQGSGYVTRDDLYRVVEHPHCDIIDYFFSAIGFKPTLRVKLEFLFDPMFTLLLLTRKQIYRIVFDQMDVENGNFISNDEMQLRICRFLDVDNFSDVAKNVRTVVEEADADNNGQIVFTEFQVLVAKLPRIFHPIFSVQASLQDFTLGRHAWEAKVDARINKAKEARNAELAKYLAATRESSSKSSDTIRDDSLDKIPSPRGPRKDKSGDDEDSKSKNWRQLEADRAEALAVGGEWNPPPKKQEDRSGGVTGGHEARLSTSPAAAREKVQNMFGDAAAATEEYLTRSIFSRSAPLEVPDRGDQLTEDAGTSGSTSPKLSPLAQRLAQIQNRDETAEPSIDALFANAREVLAGQGKREIRGRKNRRQGAPRHRRGADRQERAQRQKQLKRRQKLLNRVKQDIHDRDIKAGLVPDDRPRTAPVSKGNSITHNRVVPEVMVHSRPKPKSPIFKAERQKLARSAVSPPAHHPKGLGLSDGTPSIGGPPRGPPSASSSPKPAVGYTPPPTWPPSDNKKSDPGATKRKNAFRYSNGGSVETEARRHVTVEHVSETTKAF
eukprot:INCI9698.1.p1 GENE.INCI9698.1~~INCI9698.1.p1  ORF type:complete len:597 (+),score=111.88 INCI9698.1:349-2139(+)